MKLKIEKIVTAYQIFDDISLKGVSPEDIAKIARARMAMRPHYEAYIAFDNDVREANKPFDEDWKFVVTLEQKGLEKASKDDIDRHQKILKPFIEAINIALNPEREKEVDLEFEPISVETEAFIMSVTGFSFEQMRTYLGFILTC